MNAGQPPDPSTPSPRLEGTPGGLLRGVAQMTRCLLTEPDLGRAMQLGLAMIGDSAGVDRAYLFQNVPDPYTGEVVERQVAEWTNGSVKAQIHNQALQNLPRRFLPRAILERFEQRRPFMSLVGDLPAEVRAFLEAQDVLSFILVPICVDDEEWGHLGFDACHQPHFWNDSEVAALELAADAFGGAIRRDQVLGRRRQIEAEIQRQNQELSTLNELGQALHRLTAPNEIAELLYSKFRGLLDDRNLYIALVDPDADEICFPVYTMDGIRREPFRRKLGHGLTEHILRTRAPLFLQENCAAETERLGLSLIGRPCCCFLGVPLLAGGSVEGVIALQDYEKAGAYTAHDLRLLNTIASQAAAALCNARLFTQAKRELSDRQRAEEALTRIRIDLERAQAVGHVGSWISESGPTPSLQWSPETCRIFGISPAAFDGRLETFFSLVHPDDLEAIALARDKALRGDGVYDVQHRIVRPDGAVRWVTEKAEVECDAQRRVTRMVGVVQDVTERLQLESQLRQSQKLESIGQLAAGVAHDFNNILTVITGNAALLRADLTYHPDALGLVTEILASSERAANLTRQLLLFSRKQQLQPRAIDLNDLSSNMTKLLKRTLGEQVSLELRFESGLPIVTADPGMMEQVILNLAVNARDAMPNGGSLQIRTSTVDLPEDATAHNPEAKPGKHVRLSVSDTGTGIPPDIRARIFEPFFTTKDKGYGTGLGLATVHGIVHQHNGWIELDSKLDQGTTFHILLPASPLRPAAEAEVEARPMPLGNGETILFVEDEAPVRTLIGRILTRQRYKVITANSGLEASQLPPETVRKARLLLTDMVMPGGVSGRELASLLRKHHPGLRVIYYSGYSVEMTLGNLDLSEGDAFLQKPCSPRQLLSLIAERLAR